MSTESLRQAMAAATTYADQKALAVELAAAERAETARLRAEADLDWAATATTATLTPVAVYSPHTMASDWLGEIPEPGDYALNGRRLIAEASLWYGRLSPEVVADQAEFLAQATGAARRAAARLNMHPDAALDPFLDYVVFVRKRAGSGLPQIDQTIDANNAPAASPYPADVFDNFAPEVDPVNAGVAGTETSMRAPVIQELMGGTAPAPPPAQPAPPSGPSQPPSGAPDTNPDITEADQDKGALSASTAMAVNHVHTLADHLRATGAMPESGMDYDDTDLFGGDPDDERDYAHDRARQMADAATPRSPHDVMSREVEMARRYHEQRYQDDVASYGRDYADLIHGRNQPEHPAVHAPAHDRDHDWEMSAYTSSPYAHTGASTLPQIQQTTAPDGVTNAPTPMPQDVAFPWMISEDQENPAPPADGEMAQAPHQGRRTVADQWHGQEWPHAVVQPDAANNPGTTPPPATGTAETGRAAATTDSGAIDTAPTWADASSAAPDEVRAYSETYNAGARPAPNIPPGMSGPPTRPARLSWYLSPPEERQLPEYAAGYQAGYTWKQANAIPAFGTDIFEAGLYAGLLDNPGAHIPFTRAHTDLATTDHRADARLTRHAQASSFFATDPNLPPTVRHVGNYLAHTLTNTSRQMLAATSTDLNTMAPSVSADPSGATPFNGPGHPGPLDGQYGAAEPGGPPPYQGAPPYGHPAVPAPETQTTPVTVPDTGMTTPNRAEAFRRRVQANLLRDAAGAPLLTTPNTGRSL